MRHACSRVQNPELDTVSNIGEHSFPDSLQECLMEGTGH